MSFPQLNASQVTLLTDMANGVGAFSHVVPDPKLDTKQDYDKYMEDIRDEEQLVILGLIKEITDQCGDKLAQMFAMTNRMFRVYQITEVGQKMFQGVEQRTIQ